MLRLACVSDIHLGHRRNNTKDIIHALNKAFPDNAETAALDLIVLAGDVFDRLLDVPDSDVAHIDLWITRLLRLCNKHSICLRILEGTPSHDWKQSVMFDTKRQALELPNLDMRYVKDLSIEYIEKLGINVLYVPDEWNASTDKVFEEVQELLTARDLEQVDYAFMHGQFEYQLPPAATKAPRHDSFKYLAIVKHLIFIGHVHIYSNYERIYAQGSFDRLAHGEEAPKGHLRAEIEDDGTYRVKFVENKLARKYLNIKCYGMELEEIFEKIETMTAKLPTDSCVRIECNPSHPILTEMSTIMRKYPLFVWTKLAKDLEQTEEQPLYIEDADAAEFVPIAITKDNVKQLLLDRLAKRPNADLALLANAEKHLVELI
jgi:hypothetical protein